MTYLVKGASLLNIVLSHPDDVDTTEWSPERYDIEIREFYKEAEPRLKAVIELSNPGAQNWPVEQVKNLPRWKSESGRFVLMGDVVHAMPFYLSMGVSMAVEDAETLAECIALKKLTTSSLEKAMAVFEGVRKPRAEAVRDASLHAGDVLQMRKGPEREVRDRAIRDDGVAVGVEEEEGDDFYVTRTSYGIADRKIRDWCYGYNVAEEVLKRWF
jgi:salicylate hydroxylase